MHSHPFRWFSAAPLVFLFLGFPPLTIKQIWRILCFIYKEEGGGDFVYFLFVYFPNVAFGRNMFALT
jgi:hypothetical protein